MPRGLRIDEGDHRYRRWFGVFGPETGQAARTRRPSRRSRSRARPQAQATRSPGSRTARRARCRAISMASTPSSTSPARASPTSAGPPARKDALRDSRILSTRTLVRAIAACARPPQSVHQRIGDRLLRPARRRARHRIDAARLGLSGAALRRMGSRRRAGRVAGDAGGDRPHRPRARSRRRRARKMLLPFKLGLGATLGIGRSVHAVDSCRRLDRDGVVADPERSRQPAPSTPRRRQPVTNRTFTRTLGRVLRRPAVLHAPAFVLRAALGEMASMLVHGQRVLPAAAEQLGFRFTHRELEPALESLNL